MVKLLNIDEPAPIKDHPRYAQRYRLVVVAIIGSIFCIVSVISSYWSTAPWIVSLITLIMSGLFSLADLFSSRIFKKAVPIWIIQSLDVAFCITFLILYIVVAPSARGLEQVYGNLTTLIACILHGWCIWKAIHKHLKVRWAREVTFVCDQCQKRSTGKQPKWVARGGRDSDEETDYLLYRDSTDDDAVEIAPDGEEIESSRSKGKGKIVDEEAGA